MIFACIPQGGCLKSPSSSAHMVNESFKKTLSGECLPVALHSLSRSCHKCGNERYIVIYETVPPSSALCLVQQLLPSYPPLLHRLWAKKHLRAAGIEGTCRSCQRLSLDFSVVTPCLQLCTHARLPSLSRLKLVLGFCPYCKNAEGFTMLVRGPISVVLGWEAW